MFFGLPGSFALAAGKAEHIVVIVWDGLRPDFVTEEFTPTLYRLARAGVTFQNHHAVYLSATEVNGTALSTGAYPSRSGLMANREYRPAIDLLKPVGTEARDAVRKGDQVSNGHYLKLRTLAEILHEYGRRTAVAGTKPVAILHDRAERSSGNPGGVTLFDGRTLPEAMLPRLTNLFGPFPPAGKPNLKRDEWTTRALIGPFWEHGVPTFSLLWLSEPDYSQH